MTLSIVSKLYRGGGSHSHSLSSYFSLHSQEREPDLPLPLQPQASLQAVYRLHLAQVPVHRLPLRVLREVRERGVFLLQQRGRGLRPARVPEQHVAGQGQSLPAHQGGGAVLW